MGKYGEAIGILDLDIGGINHKLTPAMGDNEVVSNIVSQYQKTRNQSQFFKDINNFTFKIISREDNTLTDTDKEELKLLIELNQSDVMKNIMIAFKWTTKKGIEEAENQAGDMVKNLMMAGN